MDENPYRGPTAAEETSVTPRPGQVIVKIIKYTVAIGAILFLLGALLLPTHRGAPAAARRSQCTNNLKQIGLALHNYKDAHGVFPPAYTTDAEGRRLHSWRTLILPYLEYGELYKQIDLSKPWDDPANAKAFMSVPFPYQCPSHRDAGNHTTYLAVVTPDSWFRAPGGSALPDRDRAFFKSIAVIEVDTGSAVPWMSPEDADENLLRALSVDSELSHAGGVNAAMADGSVSFITLDMLEDQRDAFMSGEWLDVN